jgi:ectoine hydroxylase-related dioxygenase (phytanoyl-CoA dioxygenase family)
VLDHGSSDKPNNLLASNQAIAESQLDLSSAVPFTLRAGQMSIHHGMLAHASRPNQSQQRRCGLTARFVSPEVRQVRPSNNNEAPWWKPIVVRGVDTTNHFEVTRAPF